MRKLFCSYIAMISINFFPAILCPSILPFGNGSIQFSESSENGTHNIIDTVAIHSCAYGYSLVGNAIRTCELNDTVGVWSGEVPICSRKYLLAAEILIMQFLYYPTTFSHLVYKPDTSHEWRNQFYHGQFY